MFQRKEKKQRKTETKRNGSDEGGRRCLVHALSSLIRLFQTSFSLFPHSLSFRTNLLSLLPFPLHSTSLLLPLVASINLSDTTEEMSETLNFEVRNFESSASARIDCVSSHQYHISLIL